MSRRRREHPEQKSATAPLPDEQRDDAGQEHQAAVDDGGPANRMFFQDLIVQITDLDQQ